ncbi:MAG: ATP-grasp domain-containing protein, partial [Desulfobacterales bacterium]|nr:ATP-grasp domain-containing protein [Desulfobacterales bacterium]
KSHIFGEVSDSELYELAASFGEVDAVILGPGFEKLEFKNILNNPYKTIDEVGNKLKISKKFKSMGIPHPKTAPLDRTSGLEYPLMVKPISGAGGILNTVVKNEGELASFLERGDAMEFLAQEFVTGMPCSASLIANRDDAVVLALNEQMIGVPWLTKIPFAYCGNLTPFHSGFDNEMTRYAEKIAREFELVGSNGVDFIITEEGPVVIEANPRFQGSLDTVELATGINIFHAHVQSFEGVLPEPVVSSCFAVKSIVFADRKFVIDSKMSAFLENYMNQGRAADVPQSGIIVAPDDPITTLIETGKTRDDVFRKIKMSSSYVANLSQA